VVDGLGEIIRWILGYGDQVKVLSPPRLRTGLSDICRRMLQTYKEVN
jgi:predicted DNA-binding transcriptional regulator YafY